MGIWLRDLESYGVDCSFILRKKGTKTPFSIIIVNLKNASRTLVNRNSLEQIISGIIPEIENIKPAFILFDGYEFNTALRSIKLFPDAKTVLDAGSLRKETEILASKADYLVCSERFACSVSGLKNIKKESDYKTAFALLEKLNKNNIVITMGEDGVVFKKESKIIKKPAFKVNAVDTTGAGDIFHSAFMWCFTKNYDFECSICCLICTKARRNEFNSIAGRG